MCVRVADREYREAHVVETRAAAARREERLRRELRVAAAVSLRESCPAFVRRDVVMPFLERLVFLHTRDGKVDVRGVAWASGTTTRTISALRSAERETVRWCIAETIALAVDRHDEFLSLFPSPGLDGWSAEGHRYCARCGGYDRMHWARGMCRPCYDSVRRGHASMEDAG